MNRDDISILKSVQRNVQMAMKAINALEPKVHDENMVLLMAKKNQKYLELYQKATNSLVEERVRPYQSSLMENILLNGEIGANTLLNTSTSHIAELLIKESNIGITNMTKTLNHHRRGEKNSMDIANELLDMEKKNVEEYMKYL